MLGKGNLVEIDDEVIKLIIKQKFVLNEAYIKRIYEEWLRNKCFDICKIYVDEYYNKMQKFGVIFPKIRIKKLKSRWGCCIPKLCQVEFAMNLVKTPKECIEYVVVHELAHLKYVYHDDKFYNFVSLFIPDWKKRRDILNKVYGRIII